MPRVKLDYVVSFSNEDSENPSSNLLAYEVSKKKWLCSVGEPSCSVVLQLTHAVQISTVHIGAYHAALVEVLVGRSETPNDQFEVLVPSSVFLSPMDSRRGTGVERVRSFSGEQLAPARAHKWDRVRIVCSQPYNKHCKYGLSFIHIFETEDARAPSPRPAPAPAVPGRITAVGNYSSDEDDFKPGELFAKHRTSEAGSKNTDAQIRQASSQALRNINDSATKLVKTPMAKNNTNRCNQPTDFNTTRQKDTLMYTDDDERPHAKIDSIVQRHKDEKEQETKKKDAVHNLFKKNNERANRLESASKNFKEFLNDNDNKRNLNSSASKDSSKDDNSRIRDSSRENDKNNKDNSTSKETSRNDDRRNKDNLNNSRNNNTRDNDKRSKESLNNSINTTNSRDNDRRNKDGNTSQSRTKTDAGPSGDRDNRKRRHSGDRQKEKEVLVAGPVSSTPHTLLSGVVFALSGYENPRRARLRDAAVAMGARFERDWNPTCTHLICAFPNTPKLRTVRSSPSGAECVAARGEWVEQCCHYRRLLPWQWFATEHERRVPPPAGWEHDDKTASECDTDDEIEKVLRKQKKQRIEKSPSPQPTTSRESPKTHSSRKQSPKPHTTREKSPKPHSSRERSPKPHSSRERSPKPHSSRERSPKPHSSRDRSPKPHSSRERSPKPHSSRDKSPKPDSSREKQSSSIENSRKRSRERSQSKESQKSKKTLNFSNMSSDSDVAFVKDERIKANISIDSGDSTDEEKPSTKERIDKKCSLPDFFDGYTFVIEDCVGDAGFDKELLSRYVRAYGGVVMDASQMDSDSEISFVLSAGAGTSTNGLRVRADWLWRCHEDKQMCDVAEYTL